MNDKVGSREAIAALREKLRGEQKIVGYTSGVFDILHPGHVQYLADARSLVDVLLVGINSDASVKANKGESRPINDEVSRAQVVAGLASVDLVFIFGEQNNNRNIELLKPDFYIKAGDYSSEKLTSKGLVEQYGGRVAIVPFVEGRSTTGVIEKIAAGLVTIEGERIQHERRPAVFVDRDGTINEHIEYLSEAHRLREIPGSFTALKKMRDLGYRIIVVTNQPGIGLGYFTKEDFFAVNREMLRQATAVGCNIDRIYFCPHSKGENCRCRKPSPFMLERAAQECNIDLSKSFMIGDMTSDIKLAHNAGCRGVLVSTGRGGDDKLYEVTPDAIVRDLTEAATYISAFGPVAPENTSPISRGSVAVKESEQAVEDAVQEFNAVLGAVLGCASLIDQRTRDAAGRSPVEGQLATLRKVVDRGLALTKSSTSLTSLKACCESVREVIAASHGSGCVMEVVGEHDSHVDLPEATLIELLVGLVENVLEGMAEGTERYVALHLDEVDVDAAAKKLDLVAGRYARLSVVDARRGPVAADRQESFNPFLSQKLRTISKGVGASLAAARAIVKKVGGSVGFAGDLDGRATTLSLYFPV